MGTAGNRVRKMKKNEHEQKMKGYLAFATKNFGASLRCFEEAVAQNHNDWEARLFLGLTYSHLGENLSADYQFKYIEQNCHDSAWYRKAKIASSIASEKHRPVSDSGSRARVSS